MDRRSMTLVGGRRAQARTARRDRIIAIAQQLFLEGGFAGTSMSEVAARLGGSKATLWSYFPSKESLFEAVLERASDDLDEILTAVLRPDDEPGIALPKFAERYVARLTSPDAIRLLRLIASELERFPQLGVMLYEGGMGRVVGRVSQYFYVQTAMGRLDVPNPDEAARQFCALLKQPVHARIWYGKTDGGRVPDMDIPAAVAMILRAYARR